MFTDIEGSGQGRSQRAEGFGRRGAKNAFVVRSGFTGLGRLFVEVGAIVAKSNPQAPQAAGQAQNSDTPENLRDDVQL